jgi:hypothetical protein
MVLLFTSSIRPRQSLIDGNTFLTWTLLKEKYASNTTSTLIHLSGELNRCVLANTKTDPDKWFIRLDNLRMQMANVNKAYKKKDVELIAHISDKLTGEYSKVITVVEEMISITLSKLKSKICAFYKQKFMN